MTELENAVEALSAVLAEDISDVTVRLLLADALEDAGEVALAEVHRLLANAQPKRHLDDMDRQGIIMGYLDWLDDETVTEDNVHIKFGYDRDLRIVFYRAWADGKEDNQEYVHARRRGDLAYRGLRRRAGL